MVDVDQTDVFYWSTVDVRLTVSSRPYFRVELYSDVQKNCAVAIKKQRQYKFFRNL